MIAAPAPAHDDEATRDLSAIYLRARAAIQARQGREGEPLPPLPKPVDEFYTITISFQFRRIKQPAQVVKRVGDKVVLSWNFRKFVRLACELEPMSRVEAFELGQDDREE